MGYVFEPPGQATVEVFDSEDRFPVRRIFCVGRNYAAHEALELVFPRGPLAAQHAPVAHECVRELPA